MRHLQEAVILATVLGICATGGTAAMAQSEPYAKVLYVDGRPFIEANGERLHPFAIFINTDFPMAKVGEIYADELSMARAAGVRFVSLIITLPWPNTGHPDFGYLAFCLDFILEHHPEALIFPRIRLDSPTPDWAAKYPDEMVHFGDGSTKAVFSPASDVWLDECSRLLTAFVDFVEGNPRYAEHVCGYQLGAGETCEWFHESYRQKGNDTSPANHRQFWQWLMATYRSQEGIAKAWQRASVTRDDVVIPTSYPVRTFLEPGVDQPIIDFFAYSSDIMAERLLALAGVVKQATNRRKLVIAFYGYLFSLPDPNSGHLGLWRVLQSPDVDVLCSPFEYGDRELGGAGSVMSVIDSLPRHGKLWLMEDDTRTFVSPESAGYGRVSTPEDTFAVHRRNFASVAVHRAGLWWMDLEPAWLHSQAIWDNVGEMLAAYEGVDTRPYEPDIAFLVDAESYHYAPKGWGTTSLLVSRQRTSVYRSGVHFGLYLLDDVLAEPLAGPKVYVFLNAHHLTRPQREGIERLKRDGNVLMWLYGADFIGASEMGSITGWRLRSVPAGSTTGQLAIASDAPEPWNALHGTSLGKEGDELPRFAVVPDEATTVLGTYAGTSGEVAFAAKRMENWTSVFYGMRDLPTSVIRAIAEAFDVHVYVGTDDVVLTDGEFLSIHASTEGDKPVRLRDACSIFDALTGKLLATGVRTYTVPMSRGETQWLRME